ncbi:MAG: hypothetical protein ACLFVJ_21940 [Persicimonas sp.]
MDQDARIEQLKLNSFVFETDLTLDELEWSRIMGANGLGAWMLGQMVELGSHFIDIHNPQHSATADGEVYSFEIDGQRSQFRLKYTQTFTANLLGAVRAVLDGVNSGLRRSMTPVRFVCVKECCSGLGCSYRIMLLPTAWLDEFSDVLNIVAGVSPEDYETQPPFWRPESGEDFLELG